MEEKIVDKVKEPIAKIVKEEGLYLYDLEFVFEEGTHFLRVSIEKKDHTMDFATCEKVSAKVSLLLDELDPIQEPYILEVCSPGAEKPLKSKQDFIEAIHSYIRVYFNQPINQKDDLKGDLVAVDENTITLVYKEKTKNKTVVIPYDNILKAHLAIKF